MPEPMHDTTFAFIDLETTGGNAAWDRITEIGLRLWRNGEVVDEWQTLVNPETRISPFIQSLTGISDSMVADAPVFAQVGEMLREKLQGAVFVAHNARFDYGFVKGEFRRLQEVFSARVLCTVKLSRLLYPQHHRHGMDALIARHGLVSVERHRAMGDVQSMQAFFELARAEHGDESFSAALKKLLRTPSVPSHLESEMLATVPSVPGVYRFYGENDALLYVGKSVNIHNRVSSHFSGDHNSGRGVRMSQSLRRVEWTETAGELGALLLELKQIKNLNPIYNQRSRAAKRLLSIALEPDANGYLRARLAWEFDPLQLGQYFGLFRAKREALKALTGIAQKNELCNRLLGLEPPGEGPCFQRRLGRCQGACEGLEDVTRYNLRMQIAFHNLRLKTWPWPGMVGASERNPKSGRTDIHVIYNWLHVTTVQSGAELQAIEGAGHTITLDADSYKLIMKALLKPAPGLEIFPLPGELGTPEVLLPED
ncbi:DNA polymerase III subunit epsilon [Hydrocarboniclastica marina]|uniref:Excinuclease cho n=2 Tax=Hydrocarboniclastica marina TaxID=2259620 RepID=A0A4P7XF52_9ALTE|nr:DNA polymerase III subunit epsilon [Hydrocarboniclastica marina]